MSTKKVEMWGSRGAWVVWDRKANERRSFTRYPEARRCAREWRARYRKPRPAAGRPLSGSWSATLDRLERAHDPVRAMLYRTANRDLLAHACGTAMWCPRCETLLNAPEAVLWTVDGMFRVACAACFTPADMDAADPGVMDGRLLWPDRPARRA